MLIWIYSKPGSFPKFICYDNCCQFHKFCLNRTRTDKSKFFDNQTFVIDRLHVQGHVESCKSVYHPKLYPELDNCNSMICEQRNFWISKYKHIVKHMNQYHFIFFLYCQFDYYNEIKCEGIINIASTSNFSTYCSDPQKRKFRFLYSDDEDQSESGGSLSRQ